MSDDNLREIYKQDCEFYRYQDRLKWSRFQTIAMIEGAFLYAIFKVELSPSEALVWSVFGALLVLITSVVSYKDEADALSYMDRVKIFEEKFLKLKSRATSKFLRGYVLMRATIVIINLLNVLVMVKVFKLWLG